MRRLRTRVAACGLLLMAPIAGAQTTRPADPVGVSMADWTGVAADGGSRSPAPPRPLPTGAKGFYKHGFRLLNDSAFDWQTMYGLRFDVTTAAKDPVELLVTLASAKQNAADRRIAAKIVLAGNGGARRTVTLPWSAFDLSGADRSPLKYVTGVSVAAKSLTDEKAMLTLDGRAGRRGDGRGTVVRRARPQRARRGDCRIPRGGREYNGHRTGRESSARALRLGTMQATVEPSTLSLLPGELRNVTVASPCPTASPPAATSGRCCRRLPMATPTRAQRLTLVTTRDLPHPCVLHDAAAWQAVRDKVAKYDWAKTAADKLARQASAWTVPDTAKPPKNDPDDTYGPFLFPTATEQPLIACAMAWQLTGDKAHAEKVATFLRRLSEPATGYPKTLRRSTRARCRRATSSSTSRWRTT